MTKNDILILTCELFDANREDEVIQEITSNYDGEVNRAFVWQPLHLYGRKKPDDWSDRFSVVISKNYSHIPNSVTFKTNYDDPEFGVITLAVSTKYNYSTFCEFFAENGFKKIYDQVNSKKRYAYIGFEYPS